MDIEPLKEAAVGRPIVLTPPHGAVASPGLAAASSQPTAATSEGERSRGIDKIDVHAHYLPPDYRQALIDNGHSQPDGFPILPQWSADAHLDMMNRLGIATSMLSITSPGVLFGEDPVKWARRVNEYGAELVQKHPGRFGLLATLPLPDVDAALAELAHALDDLHADGIVMETNFDGRYLSDLLFEPVLTELDRRHATLFIHPTSPACFEHTSLGYPRPVLEYLLDTTRTIADLVLGGTLDRHPNIQIIVPHCGAALPSVADRLAGFSALFPLGGQNPGDIDVIGTLRRLHYEVGAGYPLPRQLNGLLNLVEPSQLVFGTDYPFGGVAGIERNVSALEGTSLLKNDDLRNAFRTNALSLFPNLALNGPPTTKT